MSREAWPIHIGSPRAVVNPTNSAIVWRWDLNPTSFGEHLPNENPDADANVFSLNLRYPGQYYDSESGMNYNYFRDYDAATGRYLQPDPIGLAGGMGIYGYVGNSPVNFSDPLGLVYGDGKLEMEDFFFGPTYWLRTQMNQDAAIPQGFVDFSAGFGDTISFGATNAARNWMGTNDAVDKCSGSYSAGEWTGIAYGFAAGGAAGWRSAGKKAGTEFSHWIPNRMGGPNSLWNGNYVSAVTHALSDPFRYRFAPRAWKALNPMPSQLIQQLVRIPNVYKGAAAAGTAAGASAAMNGCGCSQ